MNMILGNNSLQTDNTLPNLDGTKLLIVDDSLDTRELFEFIFKGCGAEVIAVGSAQEAFAAIQQSQPQLMISDINLQGEDGYSLIRRIRSLNASQGGQIPAIAVTGFRRETHALDNSPMGFQLYLTKPLDPDKLVAAVATLMEQQAAA